MRPAEDVRNRFVTRAPGDQLPIRPHLGLGQGPVELDEEPDALQAQRFGQQELGVAPR